MRDDANTERFCVHDSNGAPAVCPCLAGCGCKAGVCADYDLLTPPPGPPRRDETTAVSRKSARRPLLTTDKQARKDTPIARGVLDYFPLALAEIARVSKAGNDQHNPGQEMHWAKGKSTDHADCIVRHLIDRGTVDDDGMRHSAKLAWRALALLQIELEAER